MVTITLYAKQKKRHRCTEQNFGLCGRRRGWDVLREQHRNMYMFRSPAQAGCMRQVLGPGALGRPRGIGWRGRWEGGSGWGIHVNTRLIHVNVWQKPLQYCKVISLQLIKINGKKKKKDVVNKMALDESSPGGRWQVPRGWGLCTWILLKSRENESKGGISMWRVYLKCVPNLNEPPLCTCPLLNKHL